MSHAAKRHILVVDDEIDMRETLADALQENGYESTAVADGKAMWHILNRCTCHLLIMDLRLEKENGLQLAREVRKSSNIPIMMLTGKGDETDRILGLEVAADDFLMKPFNIRELLARVHALIRRSTELNQSPGVASSEDHKCLQFGDWIVDLTARELKKISGEVVELTFAEFNLLETFLKSPDRILTRDQLIERTHRIESEVFDRSIDVLILRLRRKIESNPKTPRYIMTERGIGYSFSGPVRVI